MLPEITREDFAAALDVCVAEQLAAALVEGPPVDAFTLAARLGMTVAWDNAQSSRARMVRHGRGERSSAAIFLRTEPRPERRQWAVAHEIGETLAHKVFSLLKVDPREAPADSREEVANQLAGRLLVPQDWLVEVGTACDWDLAALKLRFQTASHELLARRMLDCEPPIVMTIFDQGRANFRRANLAGRCGPPLPFEATCWSYVHSRARFCEQRGREGRVRGWPVHEPGWKREILRLDVVEDYVD